LKAELAFRSLVLDVDSTLCGIEGIDWLAQCRDPELAERVKLETEIAMRGEIQLESVYERRLSLVRPSRDEVARLAEAYLSSLAPGARSFIRSWINSGIVIALLSGGIRQAIIPVGRELGISEERIYAVDLTFDAAGAYEDFDRTSPLTIDEGKRVMVERMNLHRPVLSVGDGNTDLAARPAVDAFAGFTGFIRRGPVALQADVDVESLQEDDRLVRNGIS
jgi:phosphoserine phosphatase